MEILGRDNYICQVCGKFGNNVHHKDGNTENNLSPNLITLCKSCHKQIHWDIINKVIKQFMKEMLIESNQILPLKFKITRG